MRKARNRPITPRRSARLLARHRYFRGVHDLDQTRALVADMYCAHEMDLLERASLDAWMNAVTSRSLLYSTIGYGAATVVKPGVTGSFFPIMIPLSGGGTVQSGNRCVTVSTSTAAVVSASEPLSMRLSADCTLAIVCVNSGALAAHLSAMTGEEVSTQLRFKLGMDLTARRAARWRKQLLEDMCDLSSPDSLILAHDLSAHYAEQHLMTELLLVQPHDYSELLKPETSRVIPRRSHLVRAVKEFIDEHLDLPHDRASLAKHACCSVRTLDAAFVKHAGMTAIAYLRERRLLLARDLLSVAPAGTATVAAIAAHCGFTHTGRFPAEYRQRFGESPSATLRRGEHRSASMKLPDMDSNLP